MKTLIEKLRDMSNGIVRESPGVLVIAIDNEEVLPIGTDRAIRYIKTRLPMVDDVRMVVHDGDIMYVYTLNNKSFKIRYEINNEEMTLIDVSGMVYVDNGIHRRFVNHKMSDNGDRLMSGGFVFASDTGVVRYYYGEDVDIARYVCNYGGNIERLFASYDRLYIVTGHTYSVVVDEKVESDGDTHTLTAENGHVASISFRDIPYHRILKRPKEEEDREIAQVSNKPKERVTTIGDILEQGDFPATSSDDVKEVDSLFTLGQTAPGVSTLPFIANKPYSKDMVTKWIKSYLNVPVSVDELPDATLYKYTINEIDYVIQSELVSGIVILSDKSITPYGLNGTIVGNGINKPFVVMFSKGEDDVLLMSYGDVIEFRDGIANRYLYSNYSIASLEAISQKDESTKLYSSIGKLYISKNLKHSEVVSVEFVSDEWTILENKDGVELSIQTEEYKEITTRVYK